MTPRIQVIGWRHRRNAHHHASPMSKTPSPHRTAGVRLRACPDKPASTRDSCDFALPPRGTFAGACALVGFALSFGASLALMTIRWAAEYFGLQLVSVSCASRVLSTTCTSVGL